jgi:hypothetical protein
MGGSAACAISAALCSWSAGRCPDRNQPDEIVLGSAHDRHCQTSVR